LQFVAVIAVFMGNEQGYATHKIPGQVKNASSMTSLPLSSILAAARVIRFIEEELIFQVRDVSENGHA
jgi:hypothetical protein